MGGVPSSPLERGWGVSGEYLVGIWEVCGGCSEVKLLRFNLQKIYKKPLTFYVIVYHMCYFTCFCIKWGGS